MKYFYYAIGIASLVVAITTLFHSGMDPFFIALSVFMYLVGAALLHVAHYIHKLDLKARYVDHAVPENVPPWESLDEPAFVRKEWKRLGGDEKGWTESDYYSLKAHMLNPEFNDVHEV
jgi:hypothetical protein